LLKKMFIALFALILIAVALSMSGIFKKIASQVTPAGIGIFVPGLCDGLMPKIEALPASDKMELATEVVAKIKADETLVAPFSQRDLLIAWLLTGSQDIPLTHLECLGKLLEALGPNATPIYRYALVKSGLIDEQDPIKLDMLARTASQNPQDLQNLYEQLRISRDTIQAPRIMMLLMKSGQMGFDYAIKAALEKTGSVPHLSFTQAIAANSNKDEVIARQISDALNSNQTSPEAKILILNSLRDYSKISPLNNFLALEQNTEVRELFFKKLEYYDTYTKEFINALVDWALQKFIDIKKPGSELEFKEAMTAFGVGFKTGHDKTYDAVTRMLDRLIAESRPESAYAKIFLELIRDKKLGGKLAPNLIIHLSNVTWRKWIVDAIFYSEDYLHDNEFKAILVQMNRNLSSTVTPDFVTYTMKALKLSDAQAKILVENAREQDENQRFWDEFLRLQKASTLPVVTGEQANATGLAKLTILRELYTIGLEETALPPLKAEFKKSSGCSRERRKAWATLVASARDDMHNILPTYLHCDIGTDGIAALPLDIGKDKFGKATLKKFAKSSKNKNTKKLLAAFIKKQRI
jgi:hypothetical protein